MDDVGRVKYTPGPWMDSPYSSVVGMGILAARGRIVATIAVAPGFNAANPKGEDERAYADELRANARLIAAAPELYEALNDAVFVIESGQLKGPGAHALASSFRAVLARVKGDQ